jgi:hypothetical protein
MATEYASVAFVSDVEALQQFIPLNSMPLNMPSDVLAPDH